jgi:Tol biopolymer transport system component
MSTSDSGSPDSANWDIKIMNTDGSGQQNLSLVGDPNNFYSDRDPHFKPDGSRILFSSKRDGDSVQRIYEMDPDGRNVAPLSPENASYNAGSAKYSWDGTKVVFVKSGTENCLAYFEVANPSATIVNIPNTCGGDLWPSFSPTVNGLYSSA